MFRDKVTILDAVVVVTLMESSMLSAALISADNALHSSFPRDPMTAYLQQGSPNLLQIITAIQSNYYFPHLNFSKISAK